VTILRTVFTPDSNSQILGPLKNDGKIITLRSLKTVRSLELCVRNLMLMSESYNLSYTLVTKEELYKMGCLKIKRNKEILLLITVKSFVILLLSFNIFVQIF